MPHNQLDNLHPTLPELHEIIGQPILDRDFRNIVGNGWDNLSDGDVSSPQGHFAVVHIEPAELAELVEAVEPESIIEPGSYLVRENSDGLVWVFRGESLNDVMQHFNQLQSEYNIWMEE